MFYLVGAGQEEVHLIEKTCNSSMSSVVDNLNSQYALKHRCVSTLDKRCNANKDPLAITDQSVRSLPVEHVPVLVVLYSDWLQPQNVDRVS